MYIKYSCASLASFEQFGHHALRGYKNTEPEPFFVGVDFG